MADFKDAEESIMTKQEYLSLNYSQQGHIENQSHDNQVIDSGESQALDPADIWDYLQRATKETQEEFILAI